MSSTGEHHEPPTKIRVVADDREPADAVIAALSAMPEVQLSTARLEVGDYVIDDHFVFERKTLLDFAGSIVDGRLFRQAWALANLGEPLRGALILEGTGSDLERSNMRREAIQGALITLSLFFGLPILRARDGEESARLMIYAARQGRAFAHGALPRPGRRPKGKRKTQLAILQSLPGIGAQRASTLLDKFGSIEAIMAASQQALETIPSIGTRTAKAIRWAVSETPASYQQTRLRKKGLNG
ncbi:nuclease [bacterium]|nr:nuclease [bacterium]